MSRFNREPDDEEDFGQSKTEAKKAMERLQALGERLGAMKPEQLDKLPLTDRLRAALDELKRLKAHEAVRRHKQYIGKLMREEDEEAILNGLNPLQSPTLVRQLDLLVERLLVQGDALVGEVVHRFPAAERHTVRQHVRAAQKELTELTEKGVEITDTTERPARKKLLTYLREVAELS